MLYNVIEHPVKKADKHINGRTLFQMKEKFPVHNSQK